MSNGVRPPQDGDKGLGEVVAEVSEKASLLVREEIELAKAEVKDKVSKLTKGAVVGAAAGVFAIFGVTMLFHTFAWLLADLIDNVWIGYGIVTVVLFVLAAVAGLVAARLFKRGSPPTPELAIEEARRTRAELEAQKIQRDQVARGLERGEELTS
jgi:uncharacterized membrane protein YqjE